MRKIAILTVLALAAIPALAGPADVLKVEARAADGGWSFDVTVAHADTGWDHYAVPGGWSGQAAPSTAPGPCSIPMWANSRLPAHCPGW